MYIKRAEKELLAWLADEMAKRDDNVTKTGKPVEPYLELWPMRPRVGIRVAEIGFTWENGGATYMQCEPGGLAVCAAAERLLIDLIEEAGEEVENSKWLLAEAIWPSSGGNDDV